MKKALFIDRDGTLIVEPEDEQIDSLEKLEFLPGVISALRLIRRQMSFELVMVTNQDGLGTESFPEEDFWPAHNKMLKTLQGEGVCFDQILIDRSFPHQNLPTRKPGTAMLSSYLQGDYDLKSCYVIGDRQSDIELAGNLGCRAIFFSDQKDPRADFSSKNWHEIFMFLLRWQRSAVVERTTNETRIRLELALDGSGQAEVDSGIGFLNHMLEQFAKHSGCDLKLSCQGDLQVDEHHSIEDSAICLGQAFLSAIGNKRGLARYGFSVPMDESAASVVLDFSGRPQLEWKVDFKREKVGDLPTEMVSHFFKSFSDAACCTLHVECHGRNEHHMIEAVFKGFAKALQQALRIDPENNSLPTTKGMI